MEITTTAKLKEIRDTQLQFFGEHKRQGTKVRIQHLKMLLKVLDEEEQAISTALHKDLKKPEFESFSSEFVMVRKEIKSTLKHLKTWAAPKRVAGSILNFPSQDYILAEPYGAVLIISPWNYPFQLAMIPLIGAVAAGNTVVLKPSESAPHTAAVLRTILAKVFPEKWVAVVEGDATVAQALLSISWDYIFFTGSTAIGKIVAKAAAEFLTPVTLELGGKSPCIVDGSAPIQKTARRIVFGKFLNCGQTCIAPDYVLVKKEVKDALVAALVSEIKRAYGPAVDHSNDYGRIIHAKHFAKLTHDLKGQKILYGGKQDPESLFFEPTLVDEPDGDSPLMVEEIFGPILPIISYQTTADLDRVLRRLKNPLAFYVFSQNNKFVHQLIENYAFGGAVINDSIVHFVNPNLPFGGIGNSGIGAYHGKYSFDLFTHAKPVVKRSFLLDLPQRYAPYPRTLSTFKWILKKL